jgi:hypothetical protein
MRKNTQEVIHSFQGLNENNFLNGKFTDQKCHGLASGNEKKHPTKQVEVQKKAQYSPAPK